MTDDIRFGFELEIRGNAGAVLTGLRKRGLCTNDGLHSYHCRCITCAPDRTHATFTAQQDCTVEAEFISKILTFGHDEHYEAVEGIAEAALEANANTSGNTGLHVHVGRDALANPSGKPGIHRNGHYGNITAPEARLFRLFAQHGRELATLAQGPFDRVRTYNGADPPPKPTPGRGMPSCGNWLHLKRPTVEFRLWNSTKAPWRIHLAIATSVALVRAAADGVVTGPEDERTLAETLAPYMSDEAWTGLLLQKEVVE